MTLEQKIERIKKYVGTGPVVAPARPPVKPKKRAAVGAKEAAMRAWREEQSQDQSTG